MSRAVGAGMIVVVLLAVSAAAQVQIPPGYEIVQITENSYFEYGPSVNNHGQFAFAGRPGANEFSDEIFLYDNGELIRLTDDGVRDAFPDINDDGTIVWSRGIGPDGPYGPTLEIVMWRDGELTRLTDDDVSDYGPEINNLGHIVWSRLIRGGCEDVNAVICFYDGETIQAITDDDWSHQGAEVNDSGEIVWTRYNFCVEPWESTILMYADGDITELSGEESSQPRAATINNLSQVAWMGNIPGVGNGIILWEDGTATILTDWGGGPRLNDSGDLFLRRWHVERDAYQAWLYRRGGFYQLSDDPFWNVNGDINNVGDAAWVSGNYPWADIRLLRRVPPGGMDAGTKVEASNVQPVPP